MLALTWPAWLRVWCVGVAIIVAALMVGCLENQAPLKHGFFDRDGHLCADQTKPCV